MDSVKIVNTVYIQCFTLASVKTGQVVWFNFCKDYGFIHSVDKDIDILFHHIDNIKNKSNKFLMSFSQSEIL